MSTTSVFDATRAGQVLMWAPEGAGDFADLAWVIGGVLGNGAGVRGLDVHRAADGSLFGYVTAENARYVREVAAALGWRVYESGDTYCDSWGLLGEVHVEVTWLAPSANEAPSIASVLVDEEAGS